MPPVAIKYVNHFNKVGQSAVALTPADGEYIVGSSQSNFVGAGWFTRNGWSKAAAWQGTNPLGGTYSGLDDPNHVIIAGWLVDLIGVASSTAYGRFQDLGLTGMLPASGAIDLDVLNANGMWAVVTNDSHATGTITTAQDPAVIGVSTGEEPSAATQYEGYITDARAWLAGADGPGRGHMFNYTHNLLWGGDIEHVYTTQDMVIAWKTGDATRTNRVLLTCDQYWMTGASIVSGVVQATLHNRLYQNLFASTPTTAQAARGSNYGSALDSIRRSFSTSPNTLPGSPINYWIEAGAPYSEAESTAITPAQLKWIAWSLLTHGSRCLGYFLHTFRTGDAHITSNVFLDDWYGGPGVTGTGVYAAAKEVNRRALQVAPAVNGPFDGYFVWGDTAEIATAGFLTAVTSTNARSEYGGVDASCRWVPTEGKHYVFSTTREVATATSIPVTYRMVDQGQTQATDPFTGSSLTISRGGAIPAGYCEFSDTFALASDYRCWRID